MASLFFIMLLLTKWVSLVENEDDKLPSDTKVRDILGIDDLFDVEQQEMLVRLGDKLFPAYHRILNARDVTWVDTAGVFGILPKVKGDRSSFLEPAVVGLSHAHVAVRRASLELLTKIGTTKDTAPIVALLSDKDWTIAIAAGKALAEMGDQRTLAAMNVWLNSSGPANNDNDKLQVEVRKHVTKSRDELKARLDKEKPKTPPK